MFGQDYNLRKCLNESHQAAFRMRAKLAHPTQTCYKSNSGVITKS